MKKCTSFEEQKGTRYIWENVYFGIIIFSCLSSTKACLRFLLNCFIREIKGFYQTFLGNEVDFRDIMNISSNKIKISKNWYTSCRWKSTDNNDINILLSLENPWTFLLAKEKTWKCIIVNYRKIVQKNKLCHSKQR